MTHGKTAADESSALLSMNSTLVFSVVAEVGAPGLLFLEGLLHDNS